MAVLANTLLFRTNLFNLSCERLGYNPERWQVVRRLKIGDLYEAMYQSDLQVRAADVPVPTDHEPPTNRCASLHLRSLTFFNHHRTILCSVHQDAARCSTSHAGTRCRKTSTGISTARMLTSTAPCWIMRSAMWPMVAKLPRSVAVSSQVGVVIPPDHFACVCQVIRRSQTTVKVGNPRTPTLGANQSTSERIRTPPSGHSRPVTSARTRNEDEGGGDIDARGRLPRGVQAMNVTFGSHSPTFPMDSSVAEDQSVDGSHAPLLRELTTEQLVLELTRRQRQSSTHSLQMPMSSLLPEKMRSAALHASGGMHSVAEEDDEKQSREP